MTWSPDEFRDDGGGEDDAVRALLLPCADGKAGPARRLPAATSTERSRSAVHEALARRRAAGAAELPRGGPRLTPVTPIARPAPQRARPWLRRALVAAVLLLASSVGVGAITLRLVDFRLGSAELTSAPEPEPRPAPRGAPRPVPAPAPEPALEIEVPRSVFEAAPAPAPTPVRRAHRQRAHPVADARPAPDAAVAVPADLPPEDLLSLANERRLRREWGAADACYGAVVSRFPGTDAAVVAQIASASLHLRGLDDAPGALAAYRHALAARPLGPLAEDARWGIAEAQRALGDERGEAAALREFLERHPRSALAPAARQRLEGLAP